MRNVKKITLAAAIMAFALGGGIAANNINVASATEVDPTVLSSLVMDTGMSIRRNNPEGLRFGAKLEMSDEEMATAKIVGTGMILMPADKVDGALEYGEENVDGTTALDIPTNVYYEETDTSKSYYSVVVDTDQDGEFPTAFYNVPITARAYVKYEDGTYKYSEASMTRSIGYVATMHYLSGNAGDTNGVIEKIKNSAQKEIEINGGNQLSVEETNGYQATVKFGNYDLQLIENMSVAWSVEGDAVSVDNNGKVTALKGGTATVKAEISVAGGNSVTLTKEVSVADVSYEVANVYEYEKFTAISDGVRVKNTENFVIDLATAKTTDNKSVYLPNGTYTAKAVNESREVALEYLSVADNKVTWAAGEITVDRYEEESLTTWSTFVGGEWNLVLTADGVDVTIPVLLVNKVIKTADDFVNVQKYADNMTNYEVTLMSSASGNVTQYSGYFKLGDNIDLTGKTIKSRGGVAHATNINEQSLKAGFNGTFDGCGYTVNGGTYGLGGLFGYVGAAGVVKNAAFTNVSFGSSYDNEGYNGGMGCSALFSSTFFGTAENILVDVVSFTNTWRSGVFGRNATLATIKDVVIYYVIDSYGASWNYADSFDSNSAEATNFYVFTDGSVACSNAKKYAFTAKLSETDIASAGFDTTIWDLSGDKAAFVQKQA